MPARRRRSNLRRSADPRVWITPDRLDVASLDADQPGGSRAARRMQIALVIDIGIARGELVVANRTRLPDHAVARRRHLLVIGHDRLTEGLTIDRPGRSVIVRLAFLRALIDMAENAETEFGILVKDLPLRCVLGEMVANELRVGARFLHQCAKRAPTRSSFATI